MDESTPGPGNLSIPCFSQYITRRKQSSPWSQLRLAPISPEWENASGKNMRIDSTMYTTARGGEGGYVTPDLSYEGDGARENSAKITNTPVPGKVYHRYVSYMRKHPHSPRGGSTRGTSKKSLIGLPFVAELAGWCSVRCCASLEKEYMGNRATRASVLPSLSSSSHITRAFSEITRSLTAATYRCCCCWLFFPADRDHRSKGHGSRSGPERFRFCRHYSITIGSIR